MSLKIAVYAICKNEAKNVPLFTASANEADEICVLDTGSTDQSFRLLDNYCSIVQQTTFTPWKTIEEHDALIKEGKTPWRFDVARNMALGLVPIDIDICVICDLDERFEPGWRKKLEQIWESETTRLNVRYIFSRTAEGRPGIVYQMCRAHRRKGY